MTLADSRAVETRGSAFVRLATFTMATRFEFVLVGEDDRHLRAVGEEAIAEIEYLHEKFNYFSRSSIVSRINQRATHESVDLDRETYDVLMMCRELWRDSGGAFDITVPPLMRQWGFRNQPLAASRDRTNRDCPVGMEHVELDPTTRTIRFLLPGMEIDLGGIAKGYALDRAAAILRENGVTCALIHGGASTVVAIGSPPDEDGWGIRIHDEAEPFDVRLQDAALSVSAPRGRTVTNGDESHGHIIDPRTGKPASAASIAAVIAPIAGGATLADAWSTALLVLNDRPHDMPASFVSMIRIPVDGSRFSVLCSQNRQL